MNKWAVSVAYVGSIILANLSATYFGIWVTPINAFLLIGLEFVLRDHLHISVSKFHLVCTVLIAGLLSYLINQDAKTIAIASSVAVLVSCTIDYIVFEYTRGVFFKRSTISNIFSSLSDSIVFPLLAFGSLIPIITISHILLKILGGLVWGYVIYRLVKVRTKR